MVRTKYILAKAGDLEALDQAAELITRAYGAGSHYAKWIEGGFRSFSREYLLGQVNNPNRSLWLAMLGDKVVGTIIIQRESKHALFHKFARDADCKGLGTRLLAFAERHAKKDGFSKARVEVFTAATDLANYYVGKGYDRAIEMKSLPESEHVIYKAKGAAYGFLTLEKEL